MPTRPRARFWPVFFILALAAIALLILWFIPEMQRQYRYIRTAMVLFFSGVALLLWLLFFSRLRWSHRLAGFATVLLIALAMRFSFRIRGVNGDLLPILEPRWKARSTLLATVPAPSLALVSKTTVEGEFPQFNGPNRNGVLPGPELDSDWQGSPPRLLWKQPIGPAWSGFALQDGKAVTFEQRGEQECVTCYDLLTGHALWTHTDQAKYSTTIAGEGPRSTPTLFNNRVYSFGATGILNCLDLQTGAVVWSKNAAKEQGATAPDWGFAGSPLIVEGMAIVSVGGTSGSLAAFALSDGKVVWTSGHGRLDYSSPIELTLLGTRQVVLFADTVTGRDLAGKELWSYPWPGGHPHITLPLQISSNLLVVSSGYGTGSELLQLSKDREGIWAVERQWKSMAPKSKFGPLFHLGEYLYGLDDGIFCCVALKSGQRKWKDGRYGHGQGLLVGNTILLTSEKGEIVLIQPDPEKLVELARSKVFDDKTWNPPALAGGYLLLRNDKEAACLQLKRKKNT